MGVSVQRYFVPMESFTESSVTITGDDFHHIVRVMRMEAGDTVIVVQPGGKAAVAEIKTITDDAVLADVVEWTKEEKELPVRLSIASGLPKGDKLEYIVQKGTELGAFSFFPFQAARSVVKWDEKKAGKKTERLQKIAKEAAEQSHRTVVPVVNEPVTLSGLIERAQDYDYKLIAFEESAKQGETAKLAATLKVIKPGQSILFVFGPEGGITEKELDKLVEAGFTACGLGPRILRTETAPLYALAAVSYHLELLG